MKISSYYKQLGKQVVLKADLENLEDYEKVYISKVFASTPITYEAICAPNVIIGGTGFFYSTKPELPKGIEHIMPDYSLYDNHVLERLRNGAKASNIKHYTDYTIGFFTKGCFRKCSFCVNRESDGCKLHAPLSEFYNPDRKKIMLLDDNVLAYPNWQDVFYQLMETGKPFTFKQGIDIRLITKEFAEIISNAKYDRDIYFSFDNLADSKIIEDKLQLLRAHTKKAVRIYILCGYDYKGKYDSDFWVNDIESIFKRLEIIGRYGVAPFLMRHNNYLQSPYAGMYKNIASFCNKSGIFKKSSFDDFCIMQEQKSVKGNCAIMRYYKDFISNYPDFVRKYFMTVYWQNP